jgi:hypothetical protein
VVWQLADSPNGPGTRVAFEHRDWDPSNPRIGSVAYTWGQRMVHLKRYVETGKADPLFVNV